MSNALTELRRGIVDKLKAGGLHAYAYRPSPVTPPVALVVPAEPYITYGQPGEAEVTFGYVIANLDIVLIGGKGTNENVVEKLDEMVLETLAAIDHTSADVSAYYAVTLAGVGECLACTIAIPQRIKLP